ncbi:hypothetical protein [Paenibacillus sp. NPDC057967]|uniref:hypothetical protein n=1 Tax=Paenibacillus sp. NPDC057967 TaxID=3346293 RepID=UPI0036D92B5D
MTKVNETIPQVPTIPCDVAEAIEKMKGTFGATNMTAIMRSVLDSNYNGPVTLKLRSIPFNTLLAAISNGYEIELSPEEAAEKERKETYETLRREYVSIRRKQREWVSLHWKTAEEYRHLADGIQFAVRTLKLDIPEVTE